MIDRRSYGEIESPSHTPVDEARDDRAASEKESGCVNGQDGQNGNDNRPDSRIAQWFREWRKPVRHWLSRRASVPAAELDDLAQEVFLRLLRYSGKTPVENPLGYLLRIASNVASEWRERARVAKPHEQDWLNDLLIDDEQEPENSVWQARANARVQSAVEKLPLRQREVLLLRVNEGLTYKQIAERLELSPRIVLRDLSRAYSQLRSRLAPDDLE